MTVPDGLEERSQVGDWRIPTRVAWRWLPSDGQTMICEPMITVRSRGRLK